MIIRWISEVPSKIVKMLNLMQFPQVSGLSGGWVSARIQHAISGVKFPYRTAPQTADNIQER
jgi:hypothetical protein